jgi:hypothetical protein
VGGCGGGVCGFLDFCDCLVSRDHEGVGVCVGSGCLFYIGCYVRQTDGGEVIDAADLANVGDMTPADMKLLNKSDGAQASTTAANNTEIDALKAQMGQMAEMMKQLVANSATNAKPTRKK